MKSYDFLCGGDHGAWESFVSVPLTEDQEQRLRRFAQKNEFLDWTSSVEDIYCLVIKELEEQCEDLNVETLLVRVPTGLKGI